MKVRELIEELKKYDPELDVNTCNPEMEDTTNYWVVDVEEYSKGSSGYPNGEVMLITSE